ncbi:hypothetical protein ACO22_02530 [Paracoccidioides brasiliensis]|uniref:Uncharacterized protein n=1 Tax=Paracoccidioides brasiliensis TaxID=121759 RepID=A0A1D2JIE6_PARBR|nr:hypothetical protein ACO22_02530 [Paracoccidioides brasiliensis]
MSSGYLAHLGGTIGTDYKVYQSQPEIERLISLLIRALRDRDCTSDAAQCVDVQYVTLKSVDANPHSRVRSQEYQSVQI